MAANATEHFSHVTPCIIVHGGASTLSSSSVFPMLVNGVKKAARTGYSELMKGRNHSAVDAVEAAIKVMEDDASFNAGHGSKLNTRGEVEMDAMMMDGNGLHYGGIGGISNVANPISVARKVMYESKHCLIIGQGANQFAEEQGFPQINNQLLITESRKRQLRSALEAMEAADMSSDESETEEESDREKEEHHRKRKLIRQQSKAEIMKMVEEIQGKAVHDTVGAVAVDCFGNVACGTSTGGLTAVHPGRVGDSPIAGSGGYADNQVAAASCTGSGESIFRVNLARYALFMIQIGQTPADASAAAIRYMEQHVGGSAGIIVVSRDGEAGVAFNSKHMPWAQVKGGVLSYGLNRGEIKRAKKKKERSDTTSYVDASPSKVDNIAQVSCPPESDVMMQDDGSNVVAIGLDGADGGDVYINM